MVRYFYAWMPLVIGGAMGVLLCPYLALIALLGVSLAALAALAGAIVSVTYMLRRTISRRWHGRSGASARAADTSTIAVLAPQPTFREEHVS